MRDRNKNKKAEHDRLEYFLRMNRSKAAASGPIRSWSAMHKAYSRDLNEYGLRILDRDRRREERSNEDDLHGAEP